MQTDELALAIGAVLTIAIGPLALRLFDVSRRTRIDDRGPAVDWSLSIASALAFTLAFNLTFFIQELFLVLPKALVPGLHPTLFHNNHTWSGSDPRAALLQGTGAIATLLSGAVCAFLLGRAADRSSAARLFLIWMTYCGFLMALPQIAFGTAFPGSDLGMAMGFLHLGAPARIVIAILAFAAMPMVALRLLRPILGLANEHNVSTPKARRRWVLRLATLPGFVSLALITPFRVPRDVIEVLVVPLVVVLAGIPWMQAGAARAAVPAPRPSPLVSIWPQALILAALFAVFQLVLRRGIDFF